MHFSLIFSCSHSFVAKFKKKAIFPSGMMKRALILILTCLLLIASVSAIPQSMKLFGSQNIGLSRIQAMYEGNVLNSSVTITSDSYSIVIPGDDLETPEREGPVEGQFITIMFNDIAQDFVWIPVIMQIDIMQDYINPPEVNITPPDVPPIPEFNGTIPDIPPVEPEQNESQEEPVAPPPPPPSPPSSGGGSSGGSSSGDSSYSPPSSTISPVPKYDNESNKTITFVYHEANETKQEQTTIEEKGVIPVVQNKAEASKELDFSIIIMIGLGIILVIELFFVINIIVKMKRK